MILALGLPQIILRNPGKLQERKTFGIVESSRLVEPGSGVMLADAGSCHGNLPKKRLGLTCCL